MGEVKPKPTKAVVRIRANSHVDEAFIGKYRFCKESVQQVDAATAHELVKRHPFLIITNAGVSGVR